MLPFRILQRVLNLLTYPKKGSPKCQGKNATPESQVAVFDSIQLGGLGDIEQAASLSVSS